MEISIELFLLVVIPLILIAAGGCALCWRLASKKSYLKGYEARKEEAEAVFGSAEAEGKRVVSEAVKDGERKKRECLLQAKEEIHKSRIELEREIKDRRKPIIKSSPRFRIVH
jgi:ribonuclease Y